jgi:hypothetical protein
MYITVDKCCALRPNFDFSRKGAKRQRKTKGIKAANYF